MSKTFLTTKMADGNLYHNIEYCSRSVSNYTYAILHRNFYANVGLNQAVFSRYEIMCQNFIAWFAPKIRVAFEKARPGLVKFNPYEEIKKKSWPEGKKNKYSRVVTDELSGKSNPNDFFFLPFTKSGEINPVGGSLEELLDDEGFIEIGARPRLV